jgi:hypothetical protein
VRGGRECQGMERELGEIHKKREKVGLVEAVRRFAS